MDRYMFGIWDRQSSSASFLKILGFVSLTELKVMDRYILGFGIDNPVFFHAGHLVLVELGKRS